VAGNPNMHVMIVSGTNRPDNLSWKVARQCQEIMEELGVETELLDLKQLPREIAFDYLDARACLDFHPYQAAVDRSQHFIFVAPEYNGSIPGILKIFIDACDYPDSFRGKTAALVGIAAGETGNQTGLTHLEDILRYFGMKIFPGKVTVGKIRQKLKREGGFHDEVATESLRNMLTTYVGQLKMEN
jgi:chromate reductase, NAD(P)H dehydrogenase (quinone)